jgi:hypothetical protein
MSVNIVLVTGPIQYGETPISGNCSIARIALPHQKYVKKGHSKTLGRGLIRSNWQRS